MSETKSLAWETAKIEYENALEQIRHYDSLRRQDMAFVTTVQAAILTIVGTKLLNLDLSSFLLSIIAFLILLLGINSERRLAAHTIGYWRRASQIESEYGMSLLASGGQEVSKRKLLFHNAVVFPFYYFIFNLAWIIVWIMNWV